MDCVLYIDFMASTKKQKVRRRAAVSLATLRHALKRTQVQLAAASGIAQGDVSRLEGRADLDDVTISTLRRYVEALGGDLHVVAVVGRQTYKLRAADPER